MKRRIYLNMLLLTSVSVLVVSLMLCLAFYSKFTDQIKAGLQAQAQLFSNDDASSALFELDEFSRSDVRATLILADGNVIFDSASDPNSLENHLERDEVQKALSFGAGESSRHSDTLDARTYYYAVRLKDGSVLRLSQTTQSMWGLFAGGLPIILAIVLLIMAAGYLLSGSLTKRIVDPINRVNLEEEPTAPYDELTPFIRTIAHQRKKIAESFLALQKSSETIRAITDNMNEGVVMVDAQGAVVSINRSAAAIFGVDSSFTGGNIRELSRDIALMEGIQKALLGSATGMTIEKNKKIYNLLLSPVPETGAIIFLLDITEKTRADEHRREFSANVSHELKTPLTSIYGNAEMLWGGMVKEGDRQRFYRKIMDEAARLMALIEDIIMISKLDEREELPQKEAVNLLEVAKECVEALSQKATDFGVSISISGAGTVKGSYSMLHQMLYNLIDNAVKYNRPGGSVTVSIEEISGRVRLSVADTGIGIAPGEQERVFERFYRVDKSRWKKTGGTGLGLAIAKHVVLVHGGEIELISKPGEGSAFVVTI